MKILKGHVFILKFGEGYPVWMIPVILLSDIQGKHTAALCYRGGCNFYCPADTV